MVTRAPVWDWPAQFATASGSPLEEIIRPFGVAQTLTFTGPAGERASISYDRFAARAATAARRLAEQGVAPGSHVATVISTTLGSVTHALAVWLAGATLVSVPPPPRRALQAEYEACFRRVLSAMGCEYFITGRSSAPLAEGMRAIPADSLDGEERTPPPDTEVPAVALVQFTSGSLGSPKGVAIGKQSLSQHLNMISRCMGCDPADDVIATWLPFYHDFGLICYFLTGMCARVSQAHLHPRLFASDPSAWLRLLSAERATITGAPHFGFALASRVPYGDDLDLSSVRVALNGGERIHWDDLEEFQKVAGPLGFRWEAQLPVYGLAENTVGATCTLREHSGPSRGPGGLVSCGRALPGTEVTCAGAPDEPGELRLSGRWLFGGYYTADGFQPRTGQDFATGDAGFVLDGETYVLGRASEIISAGGRNIFAEDVEAAALQAGKPWAQGCAAFKLATDGQRFGLCLELGRADRSRAMDLASTVRAAISGELGTRVAPLLVVIPGAIPRTTSGKVQRSLCRSLYQSGQLGPTGHKVFAELP